MHKPFFSIIRFFLSAPFSLGSAPQTHTQSLKLISHNGSGDSHTFFKGHDLYVLHFFGLIHLNPHFEVIRSGTYFISAAKNPKITEHFANIKAAYFLESTVQMNFSFILLEEASSLRPSQEHLCRLLFPSSTSRWWGPGWYPRHLPYRRFRWSRF